MIGIEAVCRMIPGLSPELLRAWLDAGWVRAGRGGSEPGFRPIDIARIRLLLDLQSELEVDERAMPVVLSLLDQLYATRRQMRRLAAALDAHADAALKARLAELMGNEM
jgi:chaperone modulatory protein CbpM